MAIIIILYSVNSNYRPWIVKDYGKIQVNNHGISRPLKISNQRQCEFPSHKPLRALESNNGEAY